LIFDLAQSMGQGDVKKVITAADNMVQRGLSVDTFIGSLVEHLRNLLILRTCGPDCDLVEVPGIPTKELFAQAQRFDQVALAQDIAILEELRRQVRTSQAGRAMLDAALVRLTLSDQFSSIADLLSGGGGESGRAASGSAATTVKKKYDEPLAASTSDERLVATPASRPDPSNPGANAAATQQPEEDDDDLPAPGKVWDSSGPSLSELLAQRETSQAAVATAPMPQITNAATPSNVEPVNVSDLPRVWQGLLALLADRGPALLSLVSQGKLVGIQDGRAVIQYEKKHETFVKLLDRNGKKDIVRDALSKVANQSLGVQFQVSEEVAEADTDGVAIAAAVSAKPQSARPAAPVRREIPRPEPAAQPVAPAANLIKVTPELVENLRQSEPLIRDLMDQFGAQVVKVESAEP